MKIQTVVVGFLSQHKEFGASSVRDNDFFANEALSKLLDAAGSFVFVRDPKADEVGEFYFYGHSAAAAPTAVAHS